MGDGAGALHAAEAAHLVRDLPARAASAGEAAPIMQARGQARRQTSLREQLLEEPQRFSFDAAVMLLMLAAAEPDPARAVRFHAPVGLAFPAADILALRQQAGGFAATVAPIGLAGPSGVLPRPYSELVVRQQRQRAPAFAAFLDLLAQRPIGLFAAAGIKYRSHRAAAQARIGKPPDAEIEDPVRNLLMALCGYGSPDMVRQSQVEPDTLAYFAGHFSTYPRSAARLQAIVGDWLGLPVSVEQFAGMWLPVHPDEQSALPVTPPQGQASPSFNRLGVDAAAGARAWSVQSRIVLKIGPLDLTAFRALTPTSPLLTRLVALVRSFLGFEIAFAINPILARDAVPPLALSGKAGRLGWDSWAPSHAPRQADAEEAVFEADFIERNGR